MLSTCLLVLLSSLADVHPNYVLIFGHQDRTDHRPPDPKSAHSWATWVKVTPDHNVQEAFTVSWIGVHGVKFLYGPMPGRNLDLQQTLDRGKNRGLCMRLWGPYRISDERFECAKRRYEQLEEAEVSGRMKYNLWDKKTREDQACPSFNCLHAILDAHGQMIDNNNRYGFRASEYFVEVFQRQGYIEPRHPEDVWVWNALKPEHIQVQLAEGP